MNLYMTIQVYTWSKNSRNTFIMGNLNQSSHVTKFKRLLDTFISRAHENGSKGGQMLPKVQRGERGFSRFLYNSHL